MQFGSTPVSAAYATATSISEEDTDARQFEEAVALASSPTQRGRSTVDDLKLMYGLYKVATLGRAPTDPRPSAFNVKERQKWDAWNATYERLALQPAQRDTPKVSVETAAKREYVRRFWELSARK